MFIMENAVTRVTFGVVLGHIITITEISEYWRIKVIIDKECAEFLEFFLSGIIVVFISFGEPKFLKATITAFPPGPTSIVWRTGMEKDVSNTHVTNVLDEFVVTLSFEDTDHK